MTPATFLSSVYALGGRLMIPHHVAALVIVLVILWVL